MKTKSFLTTLILLSSLLGSAQSLTARQLIARPLSAEPLLSGPLLSGPLPTQPLPTQPLPTEPLLTQRTPTHQTSAKRTEYKEKIGLDMSVPDFNTQKIDAKVMGNRLAGILDYLMENYQQGTYNRRLSSIAGEQNEALENGFFQIKKMKFLNAVKRGKELTIHMRIELLKNAANIKQADITFHFDDGISESDKVNELFSCISHYIQAREQLE